VAGRERPDFADSDDNDDALEIGIGTAITF
jgi:hypothetical protein